MNKEKKVEELRDALFDCIIMQLKTDPTSAWARVARDLLADYDTNPDEVSAKSKAVLQKLKDEGPFKLGSG